MTSTKFFDIPELVTDLVTYLSKGDITRLMRTNHAFYDACQQPFWQSIDLQNRERCLRFLKSPEAILAMAKNAHLVQSIVASNDFFVHHMHSLRSQQVPGAAASKDVGLAELPPWLPEYAFDEDNHIPLPVFPNLNDVRFIIHGRREYYSWGDKPPVRHKIGADGVPDLDTLHVMWILSFYPHIRKVYIENIEFRNWYIAKCISKTLESLVNLTHFEVNSNRFTYCPTEVSWMFQCCPPTIECFMLQGTVRTSRVPGEVRPNDKYVDSKENPLILNLRTEPLLNLKELEIPRLVSPKSFYPESACAIMQRCPALETWHFIDFARDNVNLAVDQVIRDTCRNIRHVVIPRQDYAHNIYTQARAFLCLPQNQLESIHWMTFDYSSSQGFDSDSDPNFDSIAAIMKHHAKSLKTIRIDVSDNYYSGYALSAGSAIGKILSTCEALETLIVVCDSRQAKFRVSLEQVIEAEWVCNKLEHLELPISLQSADVKVEDSTGETTQSRNNLQDRFYNQIGLMSKLKVLKLINEAEGATFPRILTLKDDEETGASGCLSMLAGLTNLRELRGSFKVDTTESSKNMGQEEVEWMLKHWPKLQVAEFLPDNYQSIEGFVMPGPLRWMKEQKPRLKLSI